MKGDLIELFRSMFQISDYSKSQPIQYEIHSTSDSNLVQTTVGS